jgi:periplasmic protein TonB
MTTTTAHIIEMPIQSDYGAIEIKKFINVSTIRGFIITVGIIVIALLAFIIFHKISTAAAVIKLAPVQKIKLQELMQQQELTDLAPPPPTQQIMNTGPAARAGTPIPVPDAMLKPDLQDFATVDVQSRASAEGGTGVDMGNFSDKIDWDKKVDVKVREEEPAPDEFIAVEREPQTDMAKLQERIEYPELARRAGIEGRVIVRVLVGKDGKPKKTLVEYTDSDMLNKSAEKAVMEAVFTPAIQNGQPIQVWVSIPINFRLR